MGRNSIIFCCALIVCGAFSMPAASAAAWPDRPIRLVVPYAPGGSTDIVARQYAKFISETLGQSVVVENKPGAATNIGNETVARAEPDGYTFLWGVDTLATNPSVGPVPHIDVQKKLSGVSLVARLPGMVAANPKFPAQNIAQLLSMARQHPGQYTISSASLFLQIALLQKYTHMQLRHIPYKGGAPAATDAVAGQVNMVFANVPVLQALAQSGKLRALVVTSAKRSAALPDVPTLRESGLPNAVFANWYGVFAPKNTPRDIIMKMSALSKKFVDDPGIRNHLEHTGYQLEWSTPQQLDALLKEDTEQTRKFVQQNPDMFKNR